MRAYPLDNPAHTLAADDLAKYGVLSWAVSRDETARTKAIEKIKPNNLALSPNSI